MNATQQPGKIYELLPRIAGEISPVAKERRAKGGGVDYKFRGIEDIMNVVSPVLARHGVTVCPVLKDVVREERKSKSGGVLITTMLRMDFIFLASDGSSLIASVVGEGMDTGDKSCNKAMSNGFKYAVSQVFCIPFDVIDSERDDPEPSAREHCDDGLTSNGNAKKNGAPISEKQVKNLLDLAKQKGKSVDKMLQRYNLESINELPVDKYHLAVAQLKGMPDAEDEIVV